MSKHTPGPWAVNHIDGEKFRIVDSRDMLELSNIATVHFHDDQDGETKANATMIATAPRLLAALKGLLAVVNVRIDDPRSAQFDEARAAVAQAEGKPAPVGFVPGEHERMTENGAKAWAGVDPQALRDGRAT